MDRIKGNFLLANGKMLKTNEMDFSKFDFSKSIYEVLRVESEILVFWEDHYDRLKNSAKLVSLDLQVSESDLLNSLHRLISTNKLEDSNIKIVIGRDKQAFMFIYFLDYPYPEPLKYKSGVKTIFYDAERKDPNCKKVNVEFRKNMEDLKSDRGVYEALLVNKYGEITEGSRSNIFFIKGDVIITPPVTDVLPGVTRKNVIRICKELKLSFQEISVKTGDITEMDAVFITGTSPRVLPVKAIESNLFDVNNILLRKIMFEFGNLVKEYIFDAKK